VYFNPSQKYSLSIGSFKFLPEMHYTKNSVQSYHTISLKWVESAHKIITA